MTDFLETAIAVLATVAMAVAAAAIIVGTVLFGFAAALAGGVLAILHRHGGAIAASVAIVAAAYLLSGVQL